VTSQSHPLRAGAAAFALVFVAGFGFGTIRTIIVAPRLGETNAVLLELPAMLAVSWFVVGWAVRRWTVQSVAGALLMGSAALVLLLSAELALAVSLFGERWQDWAANLTRPPASLGFAAQVAFALMPLVRVETRRDH
jgi:hypothetical protein